MQLQDKVGLQPRHWDLNSGEIISDVSHNYKMPDDSGYFTFLSSIDKSVTGTYESPIWTFRFDTVLFVSEITVKAVGQNSMLYLVFLLALLD